MFELSTEKILRLITVVPALLVAASFHEFAHGWTADRLGDGTARANGRLTLNPLKHIDPIGSIVVPLVLALMPGNFLFGWAKPVPVNPYHLRSPKTDMAWVAAAGPITNFILAISGAFFMMFVAKIPAGGSVELVLGPFFLFIQYFILINIVLGIFNLIPVPPLDGGRIAVGLLPADWADKWAAIEPYGLLIIVMLFIWDPIGLWQKVIGPLIQWLFLLLLRFAGVA